MNCNNSKCKYYRPQWVDIFGFKHDGGCSLSFCVKHELVNALNILSTAPNYEIFSKTLANFVEDISIKLDELCEEEK